MSASRTTGEADRILAEYERRQRELPADLYSLTRPAHLFMHHEHEEALLWGLRRARQLPLHDRRILEIGCAQGDWLAVFQEFEAKQSNLAGLELRAEQADRAQLRLPEADIRSGDAAAMPWDDGRFDVVFQRTVLTSVLDPEVKARIAAEMLRVLAPGGAVLWLDFRYNNPRNANVRGIAMPELVKLFPGCAVEARRITLAPPIARRVAPISRTLATLLQSLRLLNTHYLAVIRKA